MDPSASGSIQQWETLQSEPVFRSPIFEIGKVRRRSRSSGNEGEFYRIETRDWVNVVALRDDGHVILVRQYRHGSDEITLEIPGGIVDDGETPQEAARRELLEEAGYNCAEAIIIGRVRSNPALFDNWTWTVLATGLTLGATKFDEHEEIELVAIPATDILQLLRNGIITHALVVAAFHWYHLWQTSAGSDSNR
ncbi:MAG: NUDIX hydrolase [Armatimonadetes bacterium]|nr:NUDIX hydrolase [Armatimonadota bacterium]